MRDDNRNCRCRILDGLHARSGHDQDDIGVELLLRQRRKASGTRVGRWLAFADFQYHLARSSGFAPILEPGCHVDDPIEHVSWPEVTQ